MMGSSAFNLRGICCHEIPHHPELIYYPRSLRLMGHMGENRKDVAHILFNN
jgi:hypothetical protein